MMSILAFKKIDLMKLLKSSWLADEDMENQWAGSSGAWKKPDVNWKKKIRRCMCQRSSMLGWCCAGQVSARKRSPESEVPFIAVKIPAIWLTPWNGCFLHAGLACKHYNQIEDFNSKLAEVVSEEPTSPMCPTTVRTVLPLWRTTNWMMMKTVTMTAAQG